MPRMAERFLDTFAPSEDIRRASGHEFGSIQHFIRRSRANSDMSAVSKTPSNLKITVETDSGLFEVETKKNSFLDIILEANMDGVRHLKANDPWSRYIWCFIIIVFVVLALIQIYSQIKLFHSAPVATNIDAQYASAITFPTIAICNNNQFRLTYITGARILNRRARSNKGSIKSISGNPRSVFEEVLEKAWDMDAVRFLRSAAHWKSRMILGCTWPNGTSCRLSDFKPVWTLSGLCWAINTDPKRPLEVVGSGVDHSLRLLLNVETYERIDACTNHFRTNSIPGLKILMYNQTDTPLNSHNGVNAPAGYSVDIRFRIQYHNRLPGDHCIAETEEYKTHDQQFSSASNHRTCVIRRTLRDIEYECECSMARAFTEEHVAKHRACSVDDYFGCVKQVIERTMAQGLRGRKCLPPCESVEYIAMQDLNRLPQNLMPALIEGNEQDDEDDVDQDEMDEDKAAYLDASQVSYIKRNAHRAYEKQARHQEDIFLRTKRRIARLRAAVHNVSLLEWGWHGNDFVGMFDRLSNQTECFSSISKQHEAITTAMTSHPTVSEERRASQVLYLIDQEAHRMDPKKFKTVADIKRLYGDRVEVALRQIYDVVEVVDKLWRIFVPSTFMSVLRANVSRMDRIVELMTQYETGKLQRRAWAEKMQSRQMRHFFDDEFTEGWYQPILQDLEYSLYKVIIELENEYWPRFRYHMQNGTAMKIISLLVFDEISSDREEVLDRLVNDLYNCAVGDVKEVTTETLRSFKRLYRELQSSYTNLFKKELPDYLENFEFGDKFVRENFAMVNVFLQQMHLEHWSQARTYGFWSLACDIGGALGLFLGASMLTIIEVLYLCYHYRLFGKVRQKTTNQYRKCVERCQNCMSPGSDHSKSSSPRESYADSNDTDAQQNSSAEERQKTAWLNQLAESSPPTYSVSRASLTDDSLEEYLDSLDVHPPNCELSSGISSQSLSPPEQPLENRKITDKNDGLKSNTRSHPRLGWLPKPRLSRSSLKHKVARERFKSPLGKPSYVAENRLTKRFPPKISYEVSVEDEEHNSQMTDSQSTPTPALFVGEVERQTTI
ncbi:hypothetical protein KIN20_029402 [Parelaphostrongylus tenuis]|uniref:Amiloride-sensitive sodium channel n=1 Tax=Parelaphostrongylus tenuis TaxID=148309 RepID=A0AAD5R2B0_PARTN|nr:hypothetical protein KIN20_029402 [Parelaphostrongylus tenuis]